MSLLKKQFTIDNKININYNIIKKNLNKFFSLIFFAQPFIYLLTSFNNRFSNYYFTYEFEIKFIVVIFAVLYLFKYSQSKYKFLSKKILLMFLGFSLLYCTNILLTKDLFLFPIEFRYLFSFLYFPVMFLTFWNLFDEKIVDINSKYITVPFMIMAVTMLIAHLTNTQFDTYQSSKLGHMGWFIWANRVGSIFAIASPILIYTMIKNRKNFFYYFIFIFHIYVILILGTKTPLFAVLISLISFIIVYIYKMIVEKKNYIKVILLPLFLYLLVIFALLPQTPTGKNLNLHLRWLGVNNTSELIKSKDMKKVTNFVLSSRDVFLADATEYFLHDSINNKLLGKGYMNASLGKIEYKWVESDFFDIFFNFGIIGLAVYLYMFYEIFCIFLAKLIKNIFKVLKDVELTTYLITVVLGITIGFTAGYIFLYPKVSIYVALVVVFFLTKFEDFIKKNHLK